MNFAHNKHLDRDSVVKPCLDLFQVTRPMKKKKTKQVLLPKALEHPLLMRNAAVSAFVRQRAEVAAAGSGTSTAQSQHSSAASSPAHSPSSYYSNEDGHTLRALTLDFASPKSGYNSTGSSLAGTPMRTAAEIREIVEDNAATHNRVTELEQQVMTTSCIQNCTAILNVRADERKIDNHHSVTNN